MTKLRFYVSCLLAVSLLTFAAEGQESQPSAEDVARELLDVSGAGQMGLQVIQQMITSFKTTMPQVPVEFWDEFESSVDANEMVDLVVPIYVKHLTTEEMAAAITYYRTPAGQAMLEKLPVILQESMAAGRQWGMQLGAEAERRLQQRMESGEGLEKSPEAEEQASADG